MNENIIRRIQNWYKFNCNGEWEHKFGVKINTLDNPGWEIIINLKETALENSSFQKERKNSPNDWFSIKTDIKRFVAYGDPNKLEEILRIFLDEFLPTNVNKNFFYNIYAPLKNYEFNIWRPVRANILDESTFEISDIPKIVEAEIKFSDLSQIKTLNQNINYNDIDYKIGDLVTCELRRVYNGVIPVIVKS